MRSDNGERTGVRSRTIKRCLDVLVAAALSILLFPVLAVVALLTRLLVGSPVLFKQVRPGLHGNPFIIYKFRSMTDARNAEGVLLSDEHRCPAFGRILRSTSLDELPELWNVLRGDMSLVGPRPLLMEYLEHYSPEQARRHEVLPGVTGWAQVNGRNAISWDDKFRLDVWYVDHWSLGLDLKILMLTAVKVFRRDGVAAPGESTAPVFHRNEEQSTSEAGRR
jgi:lipopolysaccharide/colanic/teichoic acid biosynthesis glycosyltransferase